jgi:hypothetical protein
MVDKGGCVSTLPSLFLHHQTETELCEVMHAQGVRTGSAEISRPDDPPSNVYFPQLAVPEVHSFYYIYYSHCLTVRLSDCSPIHYVRSYPQPGAPSPRGAQREWFF